MGMEIIVQTDAEAVGEYVAAKFTRVIENQPRTVLGVATGSSPRTTYRALARRAQAGLDTSGVRAFALDEYVGLDVDHPQSYHEIIRQEVTEPLGLNPSAVHVPHGQAQDLESAGPEYEAAIRDAGGVDVQLLGIGSNGHIGFNEPGSSLAGRTRLKTLAPKTRQDNARFFGGDITAVPIHCLTQGIGTILAAKSVVLVATGAAKARAIAAMAEGPVAAFCPASALQLHEHVTVVIDEDAASELTYREYYDFARDHRPDWQI